MFDVIWTDPDRELVGEHRAKKEREREQINKDKNKNRSKDSDKSLSRRSLSIRSSRSSTDSPFSFLRHRGLKQATHAKSDAKSDAKTKSNSSGLFTPSLVSSRSPLSSTSDAASYRQSVLLGEVSEVFLEATVAETSKIKSTGFDTSRYFQPLSSPHHPNNAKETSWRRRTSNSDNQDNASEVLVSSEADTKSFIVSSSSFNSRTSPESLLPPDSPMSMLPTGHYQVRPKAPVKVSVMPNDPGAWRPPEEWQCMTAVPKFGSLDKLIDEALAEGVMMMQNTDIRTNLDALKKEVGRMATSTPYSVLSRLKEVLTTIDDSRGAELVMEKKLWMLSALHHLDPVPQHYAAQPSQPGVLDIGDDKILALYESQATAMYLAALHSTKHIHHMSATPLSHTGFPNIRPITVPGVTPSVFPVARQNFQHVYSMSLPAICPSSDILGVLDNVNKSLRLGGALQLTLIDPLPLAETLGHRMRTWLEENLILNLERHYRCTNPSRLLPGWLGATSLRGPGSTRTTTRFYAVPESIRDHEVEIDPFIDSAHSEQGVRAELRSLVGRMLWMEIWGSYVTGDKWWWEDPECFQECLEMGTTWEYHTIQAVKEKTI